MRLQQGRPSRWRPADRGAHREDWTGPSSTESNRPTSNLSQYGSPDYVFGRTKIPFNMLELPDQPVQGYRAEMDGGRAPHTETRPRRRNDSMSEATTSRHQNRPSNSNRSGGRPTRAISIDEQATMRQLQPGVSSGVPDRSRTDPAYAQSEARRLRRTRPLPESTSSPDSDSTFPPRPPSNRAPSQSDRPRGNDDSNRHRAATTSTSTYQPRPRRQSSEHGNRDRDRPQPDPPRARLHSVSGRRDEGGVEQQAASSLAHPPISSRKPRRSSWSSSRQEEWLVN
jgi:hypothetical protein